MRPPWLLHAAGTVRLHLCVSGQWLGLAWLPPTHSPPPPPPPFSYNLSCSQVNNEAAIKFYTSHGFEVGDTIAGYYKRLDPPDAVLLRRTLQPGAGAGASA